ncbi:VOC family protein [Candidatus Accumulibacter phosphatis]|jgi:PhnB protein|uniref:VOC family protein n=1 Tax=Candidatus Accumulibacter phosphatis TaxID=327160 RepID=A0ABX1U0Y2_9PROT|nr:VOC family protein [Candidatus Accumulibacter phosphatis]NMQ28837.1 VOC family protein [Candidatus Accumulibacter phosphatis]
MIQTYLMFEGRCEEAIEFYKQALGAEVQMLMRYKDSPEPPPGCDSPQNDEKVMHAEFRVGDTLLMASDGRCSGSPAFQGFSLSIPATDVGEAEQYFAALADGGQVIMPLAKTFWSPAFGMLTDRFGVPWMVNVLA